MSIRNRLSCSNRLRQLEAVAIASTAAAFAITVFLITTGRAVEVNPVASGLLGTFGWTSVGIFALAFEAATFAYLERVRKRDDVPHAELVSLTGGGVLATLGLLDVFYNIYLLSLLDGVGTFHTSRYAPAIAIVLVAGLIAFTRQAVFPATRRVMDQFSTPQIRAITFAFLIIVGGVAPLVAFDGGIVGTARAAETVIDDFEDGTFDGWTVHSGSASATTGAAAKGDYGAQTDTSVSQTDIENSFSGQKPNNISWWWNGNGYTGGNSERDTFWIDDGGSARITETWVENGNVMIYDGANTVDTGIDVSSSEWYYFKIRDIDWSNNNYVLEVFNSTGGSLGSHSSGFTDSPTSMAAYKFDDKSSGSQIDHIRLNATSDGFYNTVSGTVTDKNGNSITDANITTNTSSSTTADSNGEYSLPLDDGTYDITASAPDYDNVTKTVTVSGSDQTVNFTLPLSATISGQVITSDGGQPVSNATVKALEANVTKFEEQEGSRQAALDKIAEIRAELNDPEPPEYKNFSDDVKTDGWTGSDGVLSSADNYAVVHTQEQWTNERARLEPDLVSPLAAKLPAASFKDPQLGEPKVHDVPANEPVIVTAWDASNTGLFEYQDTIDSDLPGETTDSNVTLQKIGPGGSVLQDNITVETHDFAKTGASIVSDKTHQAGTVTLSPGVYKVVPEGGGTPTFIVAGEQDADEILSGYYEGLRDRQDQLTNRAQYIQDLIDDGKFQPTTVTTNEMGHFSMSPGANVEKVGLIAYKKPDALDSVTVDDLQDSDVTRENITQDEMRQLWDESDYNGSLHAPTEMEMYDIGNDSENVTVETREFSSPYNGDTDRVAEAWDWFTTFLDEHTYSEAVSAVQQRLDTLSDEELRDHYLEMLQMAKENQHLEDQTDDILNESEVQDATIDELRNDTRQLEQDIQELENSIEAGDGSSEITNQTLSARQEFGTQLDSENVQVLVHYTNGTSETVPTSSEYVSISDNLLGGSTIHLEDYPVGDAPAATAHFRIVTEDGMGESRQNARNPDFAGEIPELDAVDLTSMNPGPDETVRVRAHPNPTAAFGGVEDVMVHGPDGTKLNSSMTDTDGAEFKTAGEGVHHVALTYSNLDGDNFTTTFRVMAADENRNMPASVRVKQSPVGTYALTGDKLSGGDASVSNGGSTVNVAGRIAQEDSAPGTVHVHTHGLSLAPDARTHVSVLRGDNGQTVSKNVRVVMHTPELSDEAIVYREGTDGLVFDKASIDGDGSQYGTVTKRQQNATIRTYTNDDGRVTVQTIESPGWVERQQHRINGIAQSLPSPSLPFGMMAPGTPGAVATPQLSG